MYPVALNMFSINTKFSALVITLVNQSSISWSRSQPKLQQTFITDSSYISVQTLNSY